ncbi:hypothetical protein [Hyphomicrobium sp.]|uniref:hypothetical protein n=1 Tax=Hyphomicrobium sp. TaxID=82 RepID=UPI002FDEE496
MRTERDELRAQTKMMAQKRATEGFVSGFMIFCFLTWVASFTWPDAMPDAPWYVYAIVIGIFTGWLARLQYKKLVNG